MAASLKELLADRVKEDDLADLYDVIGSFLGYPLALQPGSPIAAILDKVVGWIDDDIINPIILPALRAQFGDKATGVWLTLLAFALWRRPRIEQQQGTMSVVLENRGAFFGSSPVIRAKNASTGKTYTAPAGAATLVAWIGSGPYPTVTVTMTADEAGSASNAQPGDLSTYPTALIAGPVDVYVVSNTVCIGADEEDDARLLDRGRAAVGEMASSGPSKAYRSVALDPTGAFTRRNLTPPWALTYVPGITRVRAVDTGGATVAVYLASASGPAISGDVTNVALALRLFVVPTGITASISAASAHVVALGTITLDVDAASNVTAAEAVAAATLALDNFFATLPIGGARKVAGGTGYVYADKVRGVLEAPAYVIGANMTFVDVALGVGDVATPTYVLAANIVDQT